MTKKRCLEILATIVGTIVILIMTIIVLFFPTIIGLLIALHTNLPQDQECAKAAGVCFNILWILALAISNL